MKTLLKTTYLLLITFALTAICLSQTDAKNMPQPPSVELKKFEPFLGKFNASGDFANLTWAGTLEIQRAIKGWYIEQTILIKTEGIDRELRTLTTWDKTAQKYRIWRFETVPVGSKNEGEVRFEGDE